MTQTPDLTPQDAELNKIRLRFTEVGGFLNTRLDAQNRVICTLLIKGGITTDIMGSAEQNAAYLDARSPWLGNSFRAALNDMNAWITFDPAEPQVSYQRNAAPAAQV